MSNTEIYLRLPLVVNMALGRDTIHAFSINIREPLCSVSLELDIATNSVLQGHLERVRCLVTFNNVKVYQMTNSDLIENAVGTNSDEIRNSTLMKAHGISESDKLRHFRLALYDDDVDIICTDFTIEYL